MTGSSSPTICAGPRYPCLLVRPDGSRVQVKALLTNGADGTPPMLFAWSGQVHTDGPVRVAAVAWDPASSRVRRDQTGTWQLATPDGVFRVEPQTGGCGRCSGLGRWDPWNPMRHGRLPADLGGAS